jgi:cytochrome c oxidase subunit 3
MGTTVTTAERIKKTSGLGGPPPGRKGSNGNGSRKDGGEGKDDREQSFSPRGHRVTTWIIFAAVGMMFAALVVSYLALASGNEWKPIVIPRVLWLSTALIVISSLTFEVARRSLKNRDKIRHSRWLWLTLILGLGFLASQLLAWRQLVAQGIYMASNQHSAFFYLLTGAHGIHLLGGILALAYLLLTVRREQSDRNGEMKQQAATAVVSLYWHFMDGLWIFLFLLLFLWK